MYNRHLRAGKNPAMGFCILPQRLGIKEQRKIPI